MNTSGKICALVCSLLITTAVPLQAELGDYSPVRATHTESPIYPNSMVVVGVRSGVASFAVAIDENGAMTDCLATAYSHRAFADSAAAALRNWTFEPMRIHGTPKKSETAFTFHFEIEGVVVVSVSALESSELIRYRIFPESGGFCAYTLGQLGYVPKATKVFSPAYTPELARSSKGGHVLVDFYIDGTGRVRMPSVSRETDETNGPLAALAVTTLSQWEFEPPISHGRPVLLRAQQAFDFKPANPTAGPQP